MSDFYFYPNRAVCDVLAEMRKQLNTLYPTTMDRYKESMSMLIEEAQTLVNRMEAAISDWDDIRRAHDKLKELKAKVRKAND